MPRAPILLHGPRLAPEKTRTPCTVEEERVDGNNGGMDWHIDSQRKLPPPRAVAEPASTQSTAIV